MWNEKLSCWRFELVTPGPLPMTVTITSQKPYIYIYIYTPLPGVEHFNEVINGCHSQSSSNELSSLVSGKAKCKQTQATT